MKKINGFSVSPYPEYSLGSIVCGNARECRVIGADKDQQAYFDFQTFSAITINANATSGQISTTN